jgi:hypothetical protein
VAEAQGTRGSAVVGFGEKAALSTAVSCLPMLSISQSLNKCLLYESMNSSKIEISLGSQLTDGL